MLEALRDPTYPSRRALKVLDLFRDEEGVGDRLLDLLEDLLVLEPGPDGSGPVLAGDHGRIDDRARRGEVAPGRAADRFVRAVRLASTDPWAVMERLPSLATSLGNPYARPVVPEEFLTEVVTLLLDRLPAQTGHVRTLVGHLAVRLIASHGQAAGWGAPWRGLLDRAARDDDPSVRGAARNAVRH